MQTVQSCFHLTGVQEGCAECVSFLEVAYTELLEDFLLPPEGSSAGLVGGFVLGTSPVVPAGGSQALDGCGAEQIQGAFFTFACKPLLLVLERVQKHLSASFVL